MMLVTVRVLPLTVTGCRALFDPNIQRTYRSQGAGNTIWDVSGAPGGAG